MQATIDDAQSRSETTQPTAGYADKRHALTIRGQQITSSPEIHNHHSHQHTGHATPHAATDNHTHRRTTTQQAGRHNSTMNITRQTHHQYVFSYTPTLETPTPTLCAYPRIKHFFRLPDSLRCLLSCLLSLSNRSQGYLNPYCWCVAPRALEQGGN
jgi:hypothetical protein